MNASQKLSWSIVLIGIGASIPFLTQSGAILDACVIALFYLLLAGSWNLLAGFTGEFSLAHPGLALVGGYSAVLAIESFNIPVALGIPVAALATGVVGLMLGFVALRVRGIYLALITFGFAGAFNVWATGSTKITGGSNGAQVEMLFQGIDRSPYVFTGLALAVAFFVAQSFLLDSRLGLGARASAEREEVAEGLGMPTRRIKLLMFTYTSIWAGLAGAFLVTYIGIATPSIGAPLEMGLIMAMAVVGGIGRSWGPIAGVVVLQVANYMIRGLGSEYTMMLFAGVLLLTMLFARDGIIGIGERVMASLSNRGEAKAVKAR